MKTTHNRQKSYVDHRQKDLEFEVKEKVFLTVTPLKGVMKFGLIRKLSTHNIRPFEILKTIRKYIHDTSHVIEYGSLKVFKNFTYEEMLVKILDKKDLVYQNRTIPLVKLTLVKTSTLASANELLNKFMGSDNKSNGRTQRVKENGVILRSVSPNKSNVGLPYAPENWPNPGDNWSWKVGKRIAITGHYLDSEPRFCRDCCCILCCKTINSTFGGYHYIKCEAVVGEGYLTCEATDSRDEIEKILNIGICLLRGSQKVSAKELHNRIEFVIAKVKQFASR
ncbi:hypothetical protein FNV43_RR24594 [Rhamnella rubrinervis]|uniref:DUF7081 domain-containing protein n=1 Tax=Rhamnella rubrinervis TaxID=2594499 RepID=A0A8K0DYD8_9ROSA|nr:hypothetical protein FNV43_RR24594 [Rhamnella rubrinervis]